MIDFILGGARSGKSRLAEQRAIESGKQVIYIATAQAGDGEMGLRIKQHRQRRPTNWQTIEEPRLLATVLAHHDKPQTLLLVDCLTLWISNLLLSEAADLFEQEKTALLRQLPNLNHCDVILVSNETGLGVVPMGQLSRRFVDESGWLHQQISKLANRVTLVVAGLPQILKQQSL